MYPGFSRPHRPSWRKSNLVETPLKELERRSCVRFPNLDRARIASADKLAARRKALKDLDEPATSAVVYVGSIGRAEAVDGSDDDFMLLVDEPTPEDQPPVIEAVKRPLRALDDFEEPSASGIFATPVLRGELINYIGLNDDDNDNTTRRMLFLLESTWAWNQSCHEEMLDLILGRYMDQSVKDFRPPRFILNDLIRYWRTMCVDFAGKEHRGPEKWGIRNAKLRTSRKMLFAGGLLPVLACAGLPKTEMTGYLKNQFATPPVDRVAAAFLKQDETVDAGARTISAYDDFLGLLSDSDTRQELESLDRDAASTSKLFQKVKELGEDVEAGLLSLLFQPGDPATLARKYLVF